MVDESGQGVLSPASRHCTWAKPAWTNGTCQWTAVNMGPEMRDALECTAKTRPDTTRVIETDFREWSKSVEDTQAEDQINQRSSSAQGTCLEMWRKRFDLVLEAVYCWNRRIDIGLAPSLPIAITAAYPPRDRSIIMVNQTLSVPCRWPCGARCDTQQLASVPVPRLIPASFPGHVNSLWMLRSITHEYQNTCRASSNGIDRLALFRQHNTVSCIGH
jgi:hypothetical protein